MTRGEPPSGKTRRLFIALDLPDELKTLLRDVQARPRFAGLRVRWSPPEQLHLTLVFLGATDEGNIASLGDAVRSAGAAAAPFVLRLGALGAFPDLLRPKVVWCGIGGEVHPLTRLREALASAVAATDSGFEAGRYSPHLTLGRVRKDAIAVERRSIGDAVARAEPLPDRAWRVDHVVLYESLFVPGGVRHVPLVAAPLRGALSP